MIVWRQIHQIQKKMKKNSSTSSSFRVFQDNWLQIFKWLVYVKESKSKYCKVCTSQNINSKWNLSKAYVSKDKRTLRGVVRLRIDGIRDHALSDKHKWSE